MCTLVTELTHFNFRANLMSCIVARLSKKSWDKVCEFLYTLIVPNNVAQSSDQCLDTIIKVFRADLTGEASLEVVRLLNRMVKERRFNIHPTVLSCLLHLRLKTELGVRASESHTDKPEPVKRNSYGKDAARRAKGKPTAQPHLSKKARKALKEKKEIDREFRDAEAEVDKEERAVTVCFISIVARGSTDISCSTRKRSNFCSCCISESSRTRARRPYFPPRCRVSPNMRTWSTSTSSKTC
jgi:nucleolar complex protein 3